MSAPSMTPSGYQQNGCGYCRDGGVRKRTAAAYYASSEDMQPACYQALVDRGWRRSGSTYYKPDLRNACCPHYTIRLDATAFKPTKNQRQLVNHFNKYLTGPEYRSATSRLAPRSRDDKRFRRHNFDLDTVVHEAEYLRLARPVDPKSGAAVEPAHALHITLEPDHFTEEKFDLFENYQRCVHKESPSRISRSGFRNFLCSGFPPTREREPGSSVSSSPSAETESETENGSGKRLGSYHQCYRLDGKLVALGVLDLLPHGVSSVYLIYHESVAQWQFGKITAMQEIALTREFGYRYYYMGYYIESCVKMKYKMDYKPQYVLDVLSYGWHQADQAFWDSFTSAKFVAMTDAKWSPQPELSGTAGETGEEQQQGNGNGRPNIWTVNMPGVMSVDEIAKHTTPNRIQTRAGDLRFPSTRLLGYEWKPEAMMKPPSAQSICAQWLACVGPELYDKINLQLGRYLSPAMTHGLVSLRTRHAVNRPVDST